MRGCKNNLFEEASMEIIKETLSYLQEKADQANLYDVLKKMGKHRYKIAQESEWGSIRECFGINRANPGTNWNRAFARTPLINQYQRYGDMIAHKMMTSLSGIEDIAKDFSSASTQHYQPDCLGRKSRYDIKVIRSEHVIDVLSNPIGGIEQPNIVSIFNDVAQTKAFYEQKPEEYQKYKLKDIIISAIDHFYEQQIKRAISDIREKKGGAYYSSLQEEAHTRSMSMFELDELVVQKDNPELAKKLCPTNLNNLLSEYDCVIATQHMEVSGHMLELSKYITWVYHGSKEDTAWQFESMPKVTVFHQDEFLADKMLNEIEVEFKRILAWKEEDGLCKLQEMMGLMQYLYAHTMPYMRGSAAIGEWVESSLYMYHGYDLNRIEGNSVNLNAFALSPHDFIEQYSSMITLDERLEPVRQYFTAR